MIQVVNMIPASVPTWAVLAGADGSVIFSPVVCWACVEVTGGGPNDGVRVASGIIAGDHSEPADFDPGFVGYSNTGQDADVFADRCQAKATELKEAAAAAKKAKPSPIIVPNQQAPINPFKIK